MAQGVGRGLGEKHIHETCIWAIKVYKWKNKYFPKLKENFYQLFKKKKKKDVFYKKKIY